MVPSGAKRRVQEVIVTLKTQALIGLAVLSVVDVVIPVPMLGLILVFVVLQKPPWFQQVVRELYEP